MSFEQKFSPNSLRRYKRGEIIKVHLGYNIGSEEGGLHCAIVLDKNNSIYNPVITIVPLTSLKPDKDLSRLRKGEIFLGNELFVNLNSKLSLHRKKIESELLDTQNAINTLNDANTDHTPFTIELIEKISNMKQTLNLINRMGVEVNKMKKGSIALVSQISTVSKIRIYDPKTNHDVLSGIKLSNEKLDIIDHEIVKFYTK